MPTPLSLQKTEARDQLKKMAPIQLKQPVFFVPGWTDQLCLSWTEPYAEGGIDHTPGWIYTLKEWIEAIVSPLDHEKVHFVRLVEDESHVRIMRFQSGAREGKIKSAGWDGDSTLAYENFFQFAELLKYRIRTTGAQSYDIVGHSMGGLDLVAATVLDPAQDHDQEVQQFITTKPLEGLHHLITVATPFRGSPGGRIAKYPPIHKFLHRIWSPGIQSQAEAMSPDSEFIKIITNPQRQLRLHNCVQGEIHTFGCCNDRAVPDANRIIDGAQNHSAEDFELDQHSQRMGITQDPRLALALFRILSG